MKTDFIDQTNFYRIDPLPPHQRTAIPFFASLVPGGFPSPAENFIEKRLNLDDLCITNPESTFFVRVTGESMIGDHILPGNILVVDCARPVRDGKVVIVHHNGGHAVKRIHYNPLKQDEVILLSSNPAFEPIRVHKGEAFSIMGVVTFNLMPFL